MGTEESHYHEWIELKNDTESNIDLKEWTLEISDKSIPLKGTIGPKGLFLLERTDDETLPGVEADLIFTGSLNNSGERVRLIYKGRVIDEVDGWKSGSNETKRTMERTDSGWQTSLPQGGTPKRENSTGLQYQSEKEADILPLSSYIKPANQRFISTLLIGLSISLIMATLILFLKKRLDRRNV